MKLWVGDFTANGRGDVIRTGVNATYELDLFLQEADGSMTHVRRDFPEGGVVPAGDMVVPAGILDVMADGRPAVFAGGVFDTDPAFAAWRYIDGSWQQLGDPFPFPSGGGFLPLLPPISPKSWRADPGVIQGAHARPSTHPGRREALR